MKFIRTWRALVPVALVAMIGVAVLSTTSSASVGNPTSWCGPKPGHKATKSPIKLGNITVDQPGTSFIGIPDMAAAYFACLNANGGIKGHPVDLITVKDNTTPATIAADAHQLINTDHVLGIAGGSSLLEETINAAYWKSLHIYEIDCGIAPAAYESANSAACNQGPRTSSDGAVYYMIKYEHCSKIVFDQSNVPGTGYIAAGPNAIAKSLHTPIVDQANNVPITSGLGDAEAAVQAAGSGGCVVLNFTPPDGLVILQAAQKAGLQHQVKWGWSTPGDTNFVAAALGSAWNGDLIVNSETENPNDQNGLNMRQEKALLASSYGTTVRTQDGGQGSFTIFGFLQALIATRALETITGPYTRASVNKAFVSIKDLKTDLLCAPFAYGHTKTHIPNYADETVGVSNGVMKTLQGCREYANADPLVAAYIKQAKAAGQYYAVK
jgi:branched-chain amino acid transport system substrate-binding protein